MMYIVEMRHNYGATPRLAARHDRAESAKVAHEFFLSHDFVLTDEGRLYDEDNDDGRDPESGYAVFDDVKLEVLADDTVCVVQFVHANGDGPCCWIRESV